MKQIAKILGLLGALLVVVSGLNYLITKELTLVFQVIGFAGIALVFFFIYAHIDEIIDTAGSRSARYSVFALVLTVLMLVVLGLINFIAYRHPQRYDATQAKLFSLSEQSINIVKGLKEPVQVTTFFEADSPEKKKFQDLVETYRQHSDKLNIKHIDPQRDPTAVKQFQVKEINTVVVSQGQNEKKINAQTEEALTNAIIAVTRTAQKKVCFLEGHGEKSPDDTERNGMSEAKAALEKQSFAVTKVQLYQQAEVPSECSALIVAGPTKPLFDPERPKLDAYLKAGGRMIVMIDPDVDPSLGQWLGGWGLTVQNDVVVDPVSQMALGDASAPIAVPAGAHPITESFQRSPTPAFFPLARSLTKSETTPEGATVDFLLTTASEQAWGETDLGIIRPGANPEEVRRPTQDEADLKGPLNLAALVTIPVKGATDAAPAADAAPDAPKKGEKKAMMAVFGDSDFAGNSGFNLGANGDLLLNTLSFLAEEEDLLAISRPKDESKQTLSMTSAQSSFVMYMSVLIMPAIPLLLGIYTFMRKRNL